jgi:hypothetical protein
MRQLFVFAIFACLSLPAFGQYGPNWKEKPEVQMLGRQPQSGYDPFVFNPGTGRFNYVPIPYDPEPPGPHYNPFRFNWHSGHWDYVAQPLLSDYDALARAWSDSTNHVDTRLDTQQLSPRSSMASTPAPGIATTVVPPPINPHVQPFQATTKPATKSNTPASKRELELAHLRSVGKWEYNYSTGRWMFVLPGD